MGFTVLSISLFTSKETEAARSAERQIIRLASSQIVLLTSSNTWLTNTGEPNFTAVYLIQWVCIEGIRYIIMLGYFCWQSTTAHM